MKPTSVIFIIISGVLILAGVIVCCVAGFMASGQDIELYCDYVDETGNAVTEHEINGKNLSSINIDVEKAIVNIYGNSPKSYVKVENYPDKAYDLWLTAGDLNIEDADANSIFSSLRINESGFGFDGLRHYLALGKYKNKDRVINIYLSEKDNLSDIKIDLESGNVFMKDFNVSASLDIDVDDGNVTLQNITSDGKANIHGENSVFTFDCCDIFDTIADISETGTINCILKLQHIFTLNCTSSGNVYLDDVKANAEFSGVYPEVPIIIPVQPVAPVEGEEAVEEAPAEDEVVTPVSFKGDVKYGDIKISVKNFES